MKKLHEKFFDLIESNEKLKKFINSRIEKIWKNYRDDPEKYIKKFYSMFKKDYIENISDLNSLLEVLLHKYALSEKNKTNLVEKQYRLFLEKYQSMLIKNQDLNLESEIKIVIYPELKMEMALEENPEELILMGDFHYANPLSPDKKKKREKFLKILEKINGEVYKEAIRVRELLRVSYEDELVEEVLNKKLKEVVNSHRDQVQKLLDTLGVDIKFISFFFENNNSE